MASGMARQGAAQTARTGCGPRARAAKSVLLPALLALTLAGCGAGEGLDGAFGAQDMGVAGGSRLGTPSNPVVTTGTTAGVTNSAPTGSLTVGSGPDMQVYDCPPVTVRTGAATWQVTDKPSGALKLQGTITRLARECAIAGPNMQVKVGIEGRVLLGEKGAPGPVKVPIRIAVVQEGPTPRTLFTKFFFVAVDLPRDQSQATFAVVEDLVSFPLLKPAEMDRHVIYVGFDPQGTEAKEPKSKPAAKPKPKPATSSSAPAASPGDSEVFGPAPR